MPTTATYLIPYPAALDPADGPTAFAAMANRIETVLSSNTVPRFASIAARTAAIPAPATGMVCYTGGTGAGMRTYSGTAWVPLPGTEIARLVLLASQNTTSGVWTAIIWDSQQYLPYGGHSLSVNPTRFTFPYPGRYLLITHAHFTANAGGYRGGYYAKNGTALLYGGHGLVPAIAGGVSVGCDFISTVTANGTTDYIESGAIQNSGGVLTLVGGGGAISNNMIIIYAGP